MPKQRKKELIACKHFFWKLGERNGVFFADGRTGNRINLGRHSLGTKDKSQALEALKALDEQIAVEQGLITEADLQFQDDNQLLELEKGWDLYRAHVSRPRVMGGAKPVSAKRYRPVFAKFIDFAKSNRINHWQHCRVELLQSYAAWLDDNGYAYRTEYLEITTIKQAVNWLVEKDHLPSSFKLSMHLRKPTGTDTYCWTKEEVDAIVDLCQSKASLLWLAGVITALASTGLRISELASLRWTDLDFVNNVLLLTDESTRAARSAQETRRETKSSRSRSFPLSAEFLSVIQSMKRAKDGVIFHGPLGGKLKPDTVRNVLIREVLKPLENRFPSAEGDVGFKDGRLHSFRHFFCSMCANSGVPELMVMEWLGHADSSMVRHYYHLNNHEAQRRMSQLRFVENVGGKVLPMNSGQEESKAVERTAS